MIRKATFLKVFLLAFLIVSSDARRTFPPLKSKQNDAVSVLQNISEISSQIAQGAAVWAQKGATLVKALGPFLGAIGPALSILNIILGDPLEKKLDQINDLLKGINKKLDEKFTHLENYIQSTMCTFEMKKNLGYLKSRSRILADHLKDAKAQHPNNPTKAKDYFLRKMREEANTDLFEAAVDYIIESLSLKGGLLDACSIIKVAYDGFAESNGIVGSPVAIAQVLFVITARLDQAYAFFAAYTRAKAQFDQNPETTIENKVKEWKKQVQAAVNEAGDLIDNIYQPAEFARLMNVNLEKLWKNEAPNVSDTEWDAYFFPNRIRGKLSERFPGKALAIFTYRDLKEDNYFKSIRRHSDAVLRTKNIEGQVRSFNYVIEIAFTNILTPSDEVNQYLKDVDCLEYAYNMVFPFRKRTDDAANFITQKLFNSINANPMCSGRLGGMTFVWEPPKKSAIIDSFPNYPTTKKYKKNVGICKWDNSKWCYMRGRLYHVWDMPAIEAWRWIAYIWTTN